MKWHDDWMQSYNSKVIYPLQPKPDDFSLETVAHALALKCRFNGQCKFFYSVAQHSVIVSLHCSQENALWGLLHELDEVFLPDVPRPIKPTIPGWKELAEKHMRAGATAFKLRMPIPDQVHHVDAACLNAEKFDVMGKPPKEWGQLPPRLDYPIEPMSWQDAKQWFIDRYYEVRDLSES